MNLCQFVKYASPIILIQITFLLSYAKNIEARSIKEFDSGNYEARWFYQGKIPDDVSEWFNEDPKLGKNMKQEKRSDVYLVAQKAKFLSPKIREGELEIKYSSSELDFATCNGKISGLAENWSKEKWELSEYLEGDVRAAFLVTNLKGHRAEVFKKRSQRIFKILSNGTLKPSEFVRLNQAVLVELTQLKVNGKHWWTMVFEIRSDSQIPLAQSNNMMCQIFQKYPGPEMIMNNSYAYSKWLSIIFDSGEVP